MNAKNIIIGILTITTLVFGYFAFLESQKGDSLAIKEECRRVGSVIHQRIVVDYNKSNEAYALEDPEYVYNKELETCLYSGGYLSTADNGEVIRKNG